jgi:hypothetical protein
MPYLGNPVVDRFTSTKAASVYSGDGSTVAFTLEHSVGADEDILVSVDGVIQEPSVAYAVSSGTTLTFTAAPSTNSGNNIFVYYLFRTIGTVTHPPTSALSATSGTFSTNVGIGNARTDGTLHVHSGSAGTVAASTQADDLVVENNLEGGITIITPDAQSARIRFTSPSTNTDVGGAFIFYRQNINKMNVGTAVAGGILDLQSGAGVSAINADANGAVTMPKQPAFLVKVGSTQTNIALNGYVTVVIGTEIFDVGGNFASNTFTAPVTGKYQLNATFYMLALDTGAAFYEFAINTSNLKYSIDFDPNFSGDLTYYAINFNVLADMDASDTSTLTIYQSLGTQQTDVSANTTFSGYLVA